MLSLMQKKVVANLPNVKVVAHEQTLDKAQLSQELNKSRERITHFQAICEGVKAKESFQDKIPSFIQMPTKYFVKVILLSINMNY